MGNTKIGFNNFKAFGPKMQHFTKKPITLIYGPNSVGKSSFLHSQLLLAYLRKGNRYFDIQKTNFAGDEIDFGGFENFLHLHDTTQSINYEITFSNEDDLNLLITRKYSKILELRNDGFFDSEISSEEINLKLESEYENSGIKFKYLLEYLVVSNEITSEEISSGISNDISVEQKCENTQIIDILKDLQNTKLMLAVEDYCGGSPESSEKLKDFIDLFNTQLEKLHHLNSPIEKAIMLTGDNNTDDIVSRLQFYKYLSTVQTIKFNIELTMKDKPCLNVICYIDDTQVFLVQDIYVVNEISINEQHKALQEFKKITRKHKITRIHSKEVEFYDYNDDDFDLDMLFNSIIFYHRTKRVDQYFGPLRPYPERWEMFSVEQSEAEDLEKNKKDIIDGTRYGQKVYKIKYLPKFFKFMIVFFNKNGRKVFRNSSVMTDLWNGILPKKFKLSGTGTFKARNVWLNLANSVEIQTKLNNWLQTSSKLKSSYSVHTLKHPISYIELFFRHLDNLTSTEELGHIGRKLRATNKNSFLYGYTVDGFISVLRFIEGKLNIKQRYENELVFVDLLKDTEVTPKDMGLGISQLLPILISSLSSKNTSLYLEQPELHLHPAVQSEISDEFIRSAKEQNNEFMIETHSEHMLLRIMKRMRQTAKGTLEDESLRLTPDDVCLLYVDSHKGKTFIRELELGIDGALLSRWPNGFFEDSYREMFS